MNVNLRDQLKQLRLSGMSESLEVRLQEAKSSKLDHLEFLELILQDELVVLKSFPVHLLSGKEFASGGIDGKVVFFIACKN